VGQAMTHLEQDQLGTIESLKICGMNDYHQQSNSPSVSTRMCRFLPLIFLAAS
jgi:hypothetical protein